MRDLPTSVWAGRCWAFDENGLRRLSSSGGSHAMQGVEVFESVGLAAEEVKPSDEKIEEEAPIAVAAAENPLPTCGVQKPNKFKRNNIAKQSGIPNVKWDRMLIAWQVKFPKLDSKGNKISWTNRVFSVKPRHLRGPGRRSSSRGRQGLPCGAGRAGHPQRAKAAGPQLHQRSARGEVGSE